MLFLILLDTVNDAVVAKEGIVDEDMDADEGADNSGDTTTTVTRMVRTLVTKLERD